MATKKKTTKAKATKAAAKTKKPAGKKKRRAALSEERGFKLTKTQVLKYRALEAEVRAAKAEQAQAQGALDTLISEQPEIQNAINRLAAQAKATNEALGEYREYMTHLGELLGVNMADVAIDDVTGRVTEYPQDKPKK